jgi:predicted GNAT superfamily acetyltransferase
MPALKPSSASTDIRIAALIREEEFREAVALQKSIWNFDDSNAVPVRFFFVAARIGGQIFGAYDQDRMVGFCLAVPGVNATGEPFLHSHMLGVIPEFRGHGIAFQLKMRQREDALRRGIGFVEWTFDPLQLGNAYFNIERLGATVSSYVRNQYGSCFDAVSGGLRSDRCVAEWRLDSVRVNAVLRRESAPGEIYEIHQRIEVPADIGVIRRTDSQRAQEIQDRVAMEFEAAFRRGLTVTGIDLTPDGGTYLLGAAA